MLDRLKRCLLNDMLLRSKQNDKLSRNLEGTGHIWVSYKI